MGLWFCTGLAIVLEWFHQNSYLGARTKGQPDLLRQGAALQEMRPVLCWGPKVGVLLIKALSVLFGVYIFFKTPTHHTVSTRRAYAVLSQGALRAAHIARPMYQARW